MQHYISQLLADIAEAIENLSWPLTETALQLQDWVSEEEENTTAPVRHLEEWAGIKQEMLPPETMLSDDQIHTLLQALNKLLDECNCCFVLQIQVPERIQYETIRQNFNQSVKQKRWYMGFFEMCRPGTEHGQCALGDYCQCAFYKELFKDMIDERLAPEEERARALEIEVNYIKKKYHGDWRKYYPYHLDKNYDNENGEPYNYGLGDDEEDEKDNWWRR